MREGCRDMTEDYEIRCILHEPRGQDLVRPGGRQSIL
jgi:hypothetical protein